jgi:endonuclease/exonuclease/phosphatase family metal-dependent hydrolase
MQIKVITYNVNNSNQAVDSLVALCDSSYDLVLISIQEYYWFAILKHLKLDFKNYAHKYYENIWGLVTIVLSPNELDIKWEKTCFGPMYCGNKGFITCVINQSILFISAHLSHGQNNHRREIELRKIAKIIDFYTKEGPNIPVILAGDLNFRLKRFNSNKYEEKYDQLSPLKTDLSFSEHPITFSPTYKFKSRTSEYDTTRTPSYCDRILFRNVNVNSYKSIEDILFSDHRPVVLDCKILNLSQQNIINTNNVCQYSFISCFIFDYFVLFSILLMLLIYRALI